MRIHLPLNPAHFRTSEAGPSSGPLVNIGGDLVLIELQGMLSWEGEKSNGVIGMLGLSRPVSPPSIRLQDTEDRKDSALIGAEYDVQDKPTLHLGQHHLLHGKISTLQKPYAVIRRVYGDPKSNSANGVNRGEDEADEGDEGLDFDSDEEAEDVTPNKKARPGKARPSGTEDEEEEDDGPLFEPEMDTTPMNKSGAMASSSSPIYPPSTAKDYSSELDFSSPARWDLESTADRDEEEKEEAEDRRKSALEMKQKEERRKEKRKWGRERPERTRHYEVVGVVRKKVVFALR